MIKTVIKCPDGMVMVLDRQGEQIPAYQGRYHDVKAGIMKDAPPEAVFAELRDFEPELYRVLREQW